MAVQYDPVHASLPWAGVRLLLEVRRHFILSLSVWDRSHLASIDTAVGHHQRQSDIRRDDRRR